MPGGWLTWLFEQYGFAFRVLSSRDFAGDLAAQYDAIVLPEGTTRESIVDGLDPARNAPEWEWAFGIGEPGWAKLRAWVKNGGTIVAIGSAVETARELLDLPIEMTLPRYHGNSPDPASSRDIETVLRETFSSPANLIATLRERVAEPESIFYCPGSLLANEFDPANPVAFGMPRAWPVFFQNDQAYRLRPGFGPARRSWRVTRRRDPSS